MPKRTKAGRKRKAKGVSKDSEDKIAEVGGEVAPEDLEVYLTDFDVQGQSAFKGGGVVHVYPPLPPVV